MSFTPMANAQKTLDAVQALITGVGRTGRPHDGMDMLADAVQRILDAPAEDATSPASCQVIQVRRVGDGYYFVQHPDGRTERITENQFHQQYEVM